MDLAAARLDLVSTLLPLVQCGECRDVPALPTLETHGLVFAAIREGRIVLSGFIRGFGFSFHGIPLAA